MKKLLCCLYFLFASSFSFSQSALTHQKIIGITSFGSAEVKGATQYASSITEIAVDAFASSKRFTVVDRTNFDALFSEENLQKGESFIEGIVVEQGKKLGAQYIATGKLINASASEIYEENDDDDDDEKELLGYAGRVHFALKIIEVETGQIIASESLSSGSDKLLVLEIPFGTKEQAIASAIKNAGKSIFYFIDEYFPVKARIFEVSKSSKNKVQRVVVTAGRQKGCREGQILKVVEKVMVELEGMTVPRNKEIGTLKVISVDDDYFSTCKVIKGKEELMLKLANLDSVWVFSGQGKRKFEEFIDAVTLPYDIIKD